MKKWKQLLLAAGVVSCLGFAVKADVQAASQVTGVKQVNDSGSMVGVQCDSVLGADYYYLDLSTDGSSWVTVDTSSNPILNAYSLSSGKTYYARVGLCTDWSGEQKVAGTESESVQVVTAPTGNVQAVQESATTGGVSVRANAVEGANYYRLYYDDTIIGQSADLIVKSSVKMNAGTSYWCDLYACRRSPSGYVAEGGRDYEKFTTLAPAINTKSFGVVNAYDSINSFDFGVSSAYARDGLHFQFATPAGKVKKNAYSSAYSSRVDVDNFIMGNFYKYRVRSFVQCGTKRVYSAWSGYKYIGVPKKGSFKLSKNRKSLTLNFSNVNNATSYIVYSSTKQNSGFKKVKTVSAKKRSVTVKKVGGKSIKRNVTYYFRVVPNAKVGKNTYKSQTNMTYYYKYY